MKHFTKIAATTLSIAFICGTQALAQQVPPNLYQELDRMLEYYAPGHAYDTNGRYESSTAPDVGTALPDTPEAQPLAAAPTTSAPETEAQNTFEPAPAEALSQAPQAPELRPMLEQGKSNPVQEPDGIANDSPAPTDPVPLKPWIKPPASPPVALKPMISPAAVPARSAIHAAPSSNLLASAMPPLAPPAVIASSERAPLAAPRFDMLQQVGIANLQVVSPGLIRGAQPEAASLAKLKQAGVKTIISLRNEEVVVRQEAAAARALGLNFINIPMDIFNAPSEQKIEQFLRVVDDSAKQPVYVHCQYGRDRTGTMVALYRIERQGWSGDQAYREMLAGGFRPGFGQLAQVVFNHAARNGRPASTNAGGAIADDLMRRFRSQ